jgi:hypothetical protein
MPVKDDHVKEREDDAHFVHDSRTDLCCVPNSSAARIPIQKAPASHIHFAIIGRNIRYAE